MFLESFRLFFKKGSISNALWSCFGAWILGDFKHVQTQRFFNSKDKFFASTNFESFWSLELLFPASRSGFLCGKSCGFFDRKEYSEVQKVKRMGQKIVFAFRVRNV